MKTYSFGKTASDLASAAIGELWTPTARLLWTPDMCPCCGHSDAPIPLDQRPPEVEMQFQIYVRHGPYGPLPYFMVASPRRNVDATTPMR